MLATVGLGRLETWLGHDTVTATDVAEFLEQAQAEDVLVLAHEGMPKALDDLQRRRSQALSEAAAGGSYTGRHHAAPFLISVLSSASDPGLPTRVSRQSPLASPVTPTRHINRV